MDEDSVSVSFALSSKGHKVLIVNNVKFVRKHASKTGPIKWCCEFYRRKKCPARCYTQGESTELMDFNLNHNHECDSNKLARQILSNSLKRKAIEDISEKPEKIIMNAIANDTSGVMETLTDSDVTNIRWCMWHARKHGRPLPKDSQETEETKNSP